MKQFFAGLTLGTLLLAACQTAQTQSEAPAAEPAAQTAQPVPITPPPVEPATLTTEGRIPPPPTPAPAATPKIRYSSCHVDGPYIAITFDDGPNKELTPKLLDILKARGIHAHLLRRRPERGGLSRHPQTRGRPKAT